MRLSIDLDATLEERLAALATTHDAGVTARVLGPKAARKVLAHLAFERGLAVLETPAAPPAPPQRLASPASGETPRERLTRITTEAKAAPAGSDALLASPEHPRDEEGLLELPERFQLTSKGALKAAEEKTPGLLAIVAYYEQHGWEAVHTVDEQTGKVIRLFWGRTPEVQSGVDLYNGGENFAMGGGLGHLRYAMVGEPTGAMHALVVR